jgi:hypothetical protein
MSMQYCFHCDRSIDTDFDAEHFEGACNNCGESTECEEVEMCKDCDPEWLQDK